jgi:hypothetical protein
MEKKPTADITENLDFFLKKRFPNATRGEKFEGSMNVLPDSFSQW